MLRDRLIAMGVALLSAGAALAAPPKPLGVHPLVMHDADVPEHAAALVAAFEDAIREQKVQTVSKAAWETAGSCAGATDATACLKDLARRLGARAVMMVSVRLWPVIVTGQMTTAEGQTVTVPLRQAVPKSEAERLELARSMLASFTKELLEADEGELLAPLVPDGPVATVPPSSSPPSGVAPGPAGAWRKPAAWVLAAAGAAGLGVATWLHLEAGGASAELDELRRGKPFLNRDEEAMALALSQKRDSYGTSRNVAAGVGLVALIAGGVLYLTSGGDDANAAPVAVGMGAGPGTVVIRGRF